MPSTANPAGDTPAWHALAARDVVARLGTDADRGLGADEASARRTQHGPNALPEPAAPSTIARYARQLRSPLVGLLLAAAAASIVLGRRDDALVIVGIVAVNAVLGALQEGRAARSLAALRRFAELEAQVQRGGRAQRVVARDVVPGDLLLLAAGDAVAADARLVETAALEVAEAALTGESLPVAKNVDALAPATPLADRLCMVYAGTFVASGRGRALVVATGSRSEMGRVAAVAERVVPERTPLERRIARLGRRVLAASGVLFVGIVAAGLARGLAAQEIVTVAISQVVGLVPEGLPIALTIALAVGVQRMARRGAIVRRLSAVETLGATTVICSDKTGTLTRNEMTAVALWLPEGARAGRRLEVGGVGWAPEGAIAERGRPLDVASDRTLRALLEAGVLCNDARLEPPAPDDPRWRAVGDPTEAALVTLGAKAGIGADSLRATQPRVGEHPFDPRHQWMATAHAGPDGPFVVIKGAPEVVLAACARAAGSAGAPFLDGPARDAVREAAAALARDALRVLAFARVDGTRDTAAWQGHATLLGLVGQFDPPRLEAARAIASCRAAGIRPVMVTGDHAATALSIAQRLGLASREEEVIDGSQLDTLSDAALAERLGTTRVFARILPLQKLRIVEAYRAAGEVVAMTGDGVNDAPALARADVGVAMGLSGTEVAKQAATIVVTDDDFATLVAAVEEGRHVHGNVQKLLIFLFATSLDEVAVLIAALLVGLPLPLAAVQILWLNLVTEGFLTVNLAMEPLEGNELQRPPVARDAPLVSRAMLRRIALMASTSACVTLGWFAARTLAGVPVVLARTEAFTLIAVCQWFNVLSCRSATASALGGGWLHNPWLAGGLALSVALQASALFVRPLGTLLGTAAPSARTLLALVAVGSAVLWAEELRKLLARVRPQNV